MIHLVPSPPITGTLRYAIRPRANRVSCITVRVGTHRVRPHGRLVLRVRDRSGSSRTSAVDLAGVEDNSYAAFTFLPLTGRSGALDLSFNLEGAGAARVSIYERARPRSLTARVLARLQPASPRQHLHYQVNDPEYGQWSFDGAGAERSYEQWLEQERIARATATVPPPSEPALSTFSVLVPVWNTPAAVLARCIESVLQQTFPHWEMCLVDDASSSRETRAVLQRFAGLDPRIRVLYRTSNGGISCASNDALRVARGRYAALMDHDDELAPDALWAVEGLLAAHPEADVIYTDEDKIDAEGRRSTPYFKPDWSPELLRSTMYIGHLTVYRTSLLRALGGFRSEFDGTQDYDLALRASEQTEAVFHLPRVLYHWRSLPTSAASSLHVKAFALALQRRALCAHLQRAGTGGSVVSTGFPGAWVTTPVTPDEPRVSVIIPTGRHPVTPLEASGWFQRLLQGTARRQLEWLAVAVAGNLTSWGTHRGRGVLRLISDDGEPSLGHQINLGAQHAHGEVLLLLRPGVEPLSPNWIDSLLALSQWPGVGAVGGCLHDDEERALFGAWTWLADGPAPVFEGCPRGTPGPALINVLRRDVLAVSSGAMLVRHTHFDDAGGFDPTFRTALVDVDFGLKLRRRGLRNVIDPLTEFRERAGPPIEASASDLVRLRERWGDVSDPYYNANFRQDRPLFEIDPNAPRRPFHAKPKGPARTP